MGSTRVPRAVGDIVLVGGARPNFVKLAPILRQLTRQRITTTVVHTGQHERYDMAGVFFEQLGIRAPDVKLEIGAHDRGDKLVRIRDAFGAYLATRPAPRAVVVVGDVTSTVACALASARLRIPVIHVEAGLRSFDRTMPEEINRVVTDSISDLLLASEPAALDNLAHEGVSAERIRFCGNVMIDTLLDQLAAARALDMPARLGISGGAYALVTLHRPANVDVPERLQLLVELLQRLGAQVPVLFPVHPRTDRMLGELGLRDALVRGRRVRVLPPLAYREFLGVMASAALVVTDSGGVQDETSFLGIPCITLRSTTERPITVTHGTNTLCGRDIERTFRVCATQLRTPPPRRLPIGGWDGRAAERIVDAILAFLRDPPTSFSLRGRRVYPPEQLSVEH